MCFFRSIGKMAFILEQYKHFEGKILQSFKDNGIQHRVKANSGLWLGMLVGLSAVLCIIKENASYSEICLIIGLTGVGLFISSICLYLKLSAEKVVVRDFQAIYFLPAIVTSLLYLLVANKGLMVSTIWGLSIGTMGTWGVLQLMCILPCCFTIGEATAVVHASILFIMSAVTNMPLRYHLPPIHDDDITTVILQVAMLYVISVCLISTYFPMFRKANNFYVMAIVLLVGVTLPVMYALLDQNPISWIFFFIFTKTDKMIMIGYWVICLLVAVIMIAYQILLNIQATTSVRKMFHLLAVLVYVPGILYERTLLYLASGVIMALFVFLELMRYLRLPPLGEILHTGFSVFVDEKDSLISLTPIYLFCGLSFPLWMPTNNISLLALLSGILTVGVGDTAASFFGSRWGFHKWKNSDKSIEGTVACILSQIGLIFFLTFMGLINNGSLPLRGLLSSILLSFVEAQTTQVDNLALPLLMYICLTV